MIGSIPSVTLARSPTPYPPPTPYPRLVSSSPKLPPPSPDSASITNPRPQVCDLPILTQQKEGSGVVALGCLCAIVFSSLAPLRRQCYSAFYFLTFPAFFTTIYYCTAYATPWILPPLAFYAADVLLRILRWRVVVARVEGRDGG
ncbi:hypothetical protein DFH09DRAFT_1400294 [Mycena vulgaris]|nr:hypothetical protein DFH09DRAFT_1400294 [Mycena vulgaris]